MLLPLLMNNVLSGVGLATLDLGTDTAVQSNDLSIVLFEDTAVLQQDVTLTLGGAVAVQFSDQILGLTSKTAIKQQDKTLSLTSKSAIKNADRTLSLSADVGVGTHYLALACSAAVQSMIGGNSHAILMRARTAVRVQYEMDLLSRAAVQEQLRAADLTADAVISGGIFSNLKKLLAARTVVKANNVFLSIGIDAAIGLQGELALDADTTVQAMMDLILESTTAVEEQALVAEIDADTAVALELAEDLDAEAVVIAKDTALDLSADTHILSNLYLLVDAAIGQQNLVAWLFPDAVVAQQRTRPMLTSAAVALRRTKLLPSATAVQVPDLSASLDAAAGVLAETTADLDSDAAVQWSRSLDLIRDTAVSETRVRNLLCTLYVSLFASITKSLGADSAIADIATIDLAIETAVATRSALALASSAAVARHFAKELHGTIIVQHNNAASSLTSKAAIQVKGQTLGLSLAAAIRNRTRLSLSGNAVVFAADQLKLLAVTTVVRGSETGTARSIPYGTRRV